MTSSSPFFSIVEARVSNEGRRRPKTLPKSEVQENRGLGTHELIKSDDIVVFVDIDNVVHDSGLVQELLSALSGTSPSQKDRTNAMMFFPHSSILLLQKVKNAQVNSQATRIHPLGTQ